MDAQNQSASRLASRGARTTKGPLDQRLRNLDSTTNAILANLPPEPPMVPGKASPAQRVLETYRDQIESALERGYRPGTLARLIAEAEGTEPSFSLETLRIAIVRMHAASTHRPPKDGEPVSKRATKHADAKTAKTERDEIATDGRGAGREAPVTAPTDTERARTVVPSAAPSAFTRRAP